MRSKGVYPTFLVIGVKKAGTTWLYNILKSHKCVFVPAYRKEVHYFDWYYSKGKGWYESFFPKKRMNSCVKAVGEATPNYIFDKEALLRIKQQMPDGKFIITLRNPVDRLISAYRYYRQRGGKNSFKTFSKKDDKPFKMGLYSEQLKGWFKNFDHDQFLILIFEECISDPDMTKRRIADFLEVDASGYSNDEEKKRNETFNAQNNQFYLICVRIAAIFRKMRLDYFVYLFKQTKILRVFKNNSSEVETVSNEKRSELKADYLESVIELEKMINRDLSVWRG